MTFLESVQVCFKKYVDFNGRATRSEFWWFFLLIFIINLIGASHHYLFVFYFFALLLFLPGLAVQVRRLHDTDRTGWWVLLNLIPLIGAIIIFIFNVEEGTEGQNRFGPKPQ